MPIKIKKGLNLPVSGEPEQIVEQGRKVGSVALLGSDYNGIKPRLLVAEGERVKLGQSLFVDKKHPAIQFTSPGAGIISTIQRGAKRSLHSVTIQLDGEEQQSFHSWSQSELSDLSPAAIQNNLLTSGLWTSLRTRPFGHVPTPDTRPAAIFVTAMDTNPLAANPEIVVSESPTAFIDGLTVMSRLTKSQVFVCKSPGALIPLPENEQVCLTEFAGPHPAGLPGTHIHFLSPVHRNKVVWHINYQDVIAIGKLFTTGELCIERIISLAGPLVSRPRLIRTRIGANTDDLVSDELESDGCRVVSGSLLHGHHAAGWGRYLGRFHLQLSIIAEPSEREFLGWFVPGAKKFSANRLCVSHFFPNRRFAMTTSQQGSPRAMVPVGHFESVMPLDILTTPLLKALLVRDIDSAESLGCLELDEEDLALCSFVCCSKLDYGQALRASLEQIERET